MTEKVVHIQSLLSMQGISRHASAPLCCLPPDTSEYAFAHRSHVRAQSAHSRTQNHTVVASEALRQADHLHGSAALSLLLNPHQSTARVATVPVVQQTQQQSGKVAEHQQQQQDRSCRNNKARWPTHELQPRPVYLPAQLQQLADVLHACTGLEQLHAVVRATWHTMHPACLAIAMQKVILLQRQHISNGKPASQPQQVQPQQQYPDTPPQIQQLRTDLVVQLCAAMVQQLPAASCEALTAFLAAAAAGQLLLPQQALDRIAVELVHRALRTACQQRQQQAQQPVGDGNASCPSSTKGRSACNTSQQSAGSIMQLEVSHKRQPMGFSAPGGGVAASSAGGQQHQQHQKHQQPLSVQHPLARSAWALARLQYRHPAVWLELSSLAGEHLQQLSPHDCVLLSWALAKSKIQQPRLFNALQYRLEGRTQQLSPDALSCLLWSYATVGHYHHAGIAALVTTAARSMERFGPRALTRTLWACVKLRHFDPRLLSALRVKALAIMQDFEPQSLSTLMWGLASFGVADTQLAQAVAQRAAAVMEGFSVQGLANLAWGTAKVVQLQQQQTRLGHQCSGNNKQKHIRSTQLQDEHYRHLIQSLISSICSTARPQLQAAKPQEVCNLLWACAIMKHRNEQFLAAACTCLVNAAEEASPYDLAQAMWALTTLEHRSKATSQVLNSHAHNKLHMFGPQALSNWSWAIASSGMKLPPSTRAAVAQQCQVLLPHFTPQGLATTMWAISKMGFIPQQLVHEASCHILASITCYNAQDLCNISMACAKSGYREPALLQGLANAACSAAAATIVLRKQAIDPSNTCIQGSRCGSSTLDGRAGHQLGDSSPGLADHLFSKQLSPGSATILRQKQLTPQGVCNLVWSFAGMGWHDQALLPQLEQLAAAAVLDGQVKPQNIAGLVQGFALLGHSCETLFNALEECRTLGLHPKRHVRASRKAQMAQAPSADAVQGGDSSGGCSSKEVQQLRQQEHGRWRQQLSSWPPDALALLLWGCVAGGAQHHHISFVCVVLEALAAAGVSGLSASRRAQLHLALTLLSTEWAVIQWGADAGLGWAQPCTHGQVSCSSGSSSNSGSNGNSCSCPEPGAAAVLTAAAAATSSGMCDNLAKGRTPAVVAILQGRLAQWCATAWQHEEAAATLSDTEQEVLQVLQGLGLQPLPQRWIQPARCSGRAEGVPAGKGCSGGATLLSGWSSHGLRVNIGVTREALGVGHQPVAVEVCSGRSVTSSWPVRIVGNTALKHQCLRAAGWRVVVLTEDEWDSLVGQQQAQQHFLRELLKG